MKTNPNITEPRWLQWLLIGTALAFLLLLLVIPLAAVFYEALREGWQTYLESLTNPEARAAIRLTLIAAAIVVPVNAVLGIAMAWLLTRFDFRGKQLFTTLLDLAGWRRGACRLSSPFPASSSPPCSSPSPS